MMVLNRKWLYLFPLLASFSACCIFGKRQISIFPVSSEALAQLPYVENQRVRFLVDGRDTLVTRVRWVRGSDRMACCPECFCCLNIIKYQFAELREVNSDSLVMIVGSAGRPRCDLSVGTRGRDLFGTSTLNFSLAPTDEPCAAVELVDTLRMSGRAYAGVYQVRAVEDGFAPRSLFFQPQRGVLQLTGHDGRNYRLLE